MPNPEGKNGYKHQTTPSGEALTEALTKYATRSYSWEQKLQCLREDLGYTIKKRTLNKLELRLGIGSVRKPPPIEVSRQAVIDEVSRDTLQLNGPAYFQLQLKRRGLMIPTCVAATSATEKWADFGEGGEARTLPDEGTRTSKAC
ncbi:hypothetical protein B0H11DRAFT_1925660 [Mycena galericulata]|nr:hypothetical protein B0H11DRAFT_1925660 [Mycena galericulata]